MKKDSDEKALSLDRIVINLCEKHVIPTQRTASIQVEIARELAAKDAEIADLRKALKPFAEIQVSDLCWGYWVVNGTPSKYTFRRDDVEIARAALNNGGGE